MTIYRHRFYRWSAMTAALVTIVMALGADWSRFVPLRQVAVNVDPRSGVPGKITFGMTQSEVEKRLGSPVFTVMNSGPMDAYRDVFAITSFGGPSRKAWQFSFRFEEAKRRARVDLKLDIHHLGRQYVLDSRTTPGDMERLFGCAATPAAFISAADLSCPMTKRSDLGADYLRYHLVGTGMTCHFYFGRLSSVDIVDDSLQSSSHSAPGDRPVNG